MLIGQVAPMTKSTSGYCCFLGSNLIPWSSSKQRVVSRSSAESEYRDLANSADELIWIEALLTELHLPLSSAVLLCDNLSATQLTANPIIHVRTKHVGIDLLSTRLFKFIYTPLKEQLADIMTKPLPAQRFQSLRNKLTVLHNLAYQLAGMRK